MTTKIFIDETPPPSTAEIEKFDRATKAWTKINPNLEALIGGCVYVAPARSGMAQTPQIQQMPGKPDTSN